MNRPIVWFYCHQVEDRLAHANTEMHPTASEYDTRMCPKRGWATLNSSWWLKTFGIWCNRAGRSKLTLNGVLQLTMNENPTDGTRTSWINVKLGCKGWTISELQTWATKLETTALPTWRWRHLVTTHSTSAQRWKSKCATTNDYSILLARATSATILNYNSTELKICNLCLSVQWCFCNTINIRKETGLTMTKFRHSKTCRVHKEGKLV